MTLAYDGTDFHGSQLQPGLRTVQGVLQEALLRVTGETIVLDFAGRTDAGVHAAGQVVSLQTAFRPGPTALLQALNAETPPDLAVLQAEEVEPAFSARRSARQRWYRYRIDNGAVARPLHRHSCAFIRQPLDIDLMGQAGQHWLGVHDFVAFGDIPGEHGTSVRRVDEVRVERAGDEVAIDLKASAFLRHMARSMVGVLIRTGRGALAPAEAGRIMDQRDRAGAGPVVPAKGLCLMAVSYTASLPSADEGSGEGLSA